MSLLTSLLKYRNQIHVARDIPIIFIHLRKFYDTCIFSRLFVFMWSMTSSHVIIPTVTTRHVNFADPFFVFHSLLLPWLWPTPQHRLRHVKSLLVRNLTLPDIFHSSHDALSVSVYFTLHSTHYPDKGTCSSFTEMTLINFELHVDLQSNAFFEQEVEATISFSYGGCFCFPDYFLTVTIADVTLIDT